MKLIEFGWRSRVNIAPEQQQLYISKNLGFFKKPGLEGRTVWTNHLDAL